MSLALWTGIALRFLARSWRATAILGTMVAGAVAALVLLAALAVGVNDAMVRNSVGLYAGHLAGDALPAESDLGALRVQGVRAVLERLTVPGVLHSDRGAQPIGLVLVDPQAEAAATALPRKAAAGHYPAAGEARVYLGLPIAEALGVGVGERVRFLAGGATAPVPLEVSGVFETGVDRIDRGLAFLPRGGVPAEAPSRSVAVFLEDGVDPQAVREAFVAAAPELAGRLRTWQELMPALEQLTELNYVSMGIVTALVFGVVALGVAGAFVIFILRHLGEYAVMKAMGVSAGEIALLLALQVGLMGLAAAAIGTLVGIALVLGLAHAGIDLGALTSRNPYFAVSGVIHPRLTPFSAGLPPVLAVAFALVAALWPVAHVVRRPAAEVLRSL